MKVEIQSASARYVEDLSLEDIIKCLADAPRRGDIIDDPEGARFIRLSDTLTKAIVNSLKAFDFRLHDRSQTVKVLRDQVKQLTEMNTSNIVQTLEAIRKTK